MDQLKILIVDDDIEVVSTLKKGLERVGYKCKGASSGGKALKIYKKEKFEKAAEIKEVINLILSQIHKSSLINEPLNKANVMFEISETLSKDYILLMEGKFFIKSNKIL